MCFDDVAIRVDGLGKCYEIYTSPADRLKQFIYPKLTKFIQGSSKKYYQEFWGLQDISFEVRKGEAIGIIGRNGAGKSTLLQLICGTLSPTSGSVQTNGRVAALLELGSGFNPEFTGRENVFLNASILGLSNEEITGRFSEIEKFADIGEYIDQPVKMYSSGMLVRLAFAVIAHVDPDILIVDEALSVGDAVFNQKCMRFIRNFQRNNTLIFVSHDIGSVNNFCNTAIWLNKGRVASYGSVQAVTRDYAKFTEEQIYGEEVELISIDKKAGSITLPESSDSSKLNYAAEYLIKTNLNEANGWQTGSAFIRQVEFSSLDGDTSDVFKGGERVRLTISGESTIPLASPILGFLLRDRLGQDIIGENTLAFTSLNPRFLNSGEKIQGIFEFVLPMLPNGEYSLVASIADGSLEKNIQHHWLHDALILRVVNSKVRYGLAGIQFEKVSMDIKYD